MEEYTKTPANCPLVCACKGSKAEIARNGRTLTHFKEEALNYIYRSEPVTKYEEPTLPYSKSAMVTRKLRKSQTDYTSSSKEIKKTHAIIYAEVREGLTDHDVCERFVLAINALEGTEDEADGWKIKGSDKGKGKGTSKGKGKSKGSTKATKITI